MKSISLGLCSLLLLQTNLSFAQTATPTPTPNPLNEDMFLQARLEQGSTSWLIDKTRTILSNTKIDDRLQGEVPIEPIPVFELDELSQDPNFIKYRDALSSIFNVNLTKAAIRIRIPSLYYKITSLHATPLALNVMDPNLTLKVNAIISGLAIKLPQGIAVDFMIPNPKTKVLESYFTASVDTASVNIPESHAPLKFNVEFETIRNKALSFILKGYNFDEIPDYVKNALKVVPILAGVKNEPFGANNIKVNPITVKLNHLSRTVDLDTFKPLIQQKMPTIMTGIFTLLANSLKKTIGPKILKTVFASNLQSTVTAATAAIYTRYNTVSFAQPQKQQLALGIQGDLCTLDTFKQYQDQCMLHEPDAPPVRNRTDEEMQKAHDEVTETLARGNADVACSVSEEYVNRILKTTTQTKLWDEKLKDEHLALGPKGAFVIFNQKTQNPEFFIDLLYFGDGKMQRILVNEDHPLRFPLRMSTSMKFVIKEGTPFLVIEVGKILSDIDEIMDGIPEYDMGTRTIKLFKKKIANTILKLAAKVEGSTVLDIDIPVFKDVGLEKTTYEVSPFGRLNLYFKL